MILDAAWLARGWLSVYAASSTDKDRPAMCRTVHIEQHTHGLRLSATDSYMILTTWVPEVDYHDDPEPDLDEAPDQQAVAIDTHDRGANLLAHLLKLTKAEDAKEIDVRVRLAVPVAGDDENMVAFDGMEATAVVIDHPDHERVQLETYDGGYPDVKPLLARFKPVRTDAIALSHENVGRLVRVAKIHGSGVEHPMRWQWGGNNKMGGLEFGAEPAVRGLLMPVRWDFERDAPWAQPAGDDGEQQEMGA